MGLRQRKWAERRRAWLIQQMGGCCHKCGSTSNLEFDHIDHRKKTWYSRKVEYSWRMSKYWQDWQDDNLQLLCTNCHEEKPKLMAIDYRPDYIGQPDQPF